MAETKEVPLFPLKQKYTSNITSKVSKIQSSELNDIKFLNINVRHTRGLSKFILHLVILIFIKQIEVVEAIFKVPNNPKK